MHNHVARSLIGVLAVAAWFGEKQYADERLATIKSESEAAKIEWPVSLVSDFGDRSFGDEIVTDQEVVSLSDLIAANEAVGDDEPSMYIDEVVGPAHAVEEVVTVVADADDRANDSQPGPVRRQLRREFRVTAYCDRGVTAAGVPSGVGQCAAPSFIPFGSEIYIPALDRWFVVTDRTHQRFRHNTIDLFMPSRTQCLNFGRRYTDAVVVFPEKKHRYGCRSILKIVSAARARDRQADASGVAPTIEGVVRMIFWGRSPFEVLSFNGGLNFGSPALVRNPSLSDQPS